ncbi:barstar family protein [Sandaracinobacter sp. RS1-74]|uniref:barstar family protein n=1 Tax=Sandaracinobacteroides sayramensis TaxID=2913411 RepID=UPI001EDB313B|nr:barstar family protein [Sandaracinobacteroides sayramensis]MCG2839656.1 barstar family protein [Sandaracinobacteroides sayramensis]
MVPAFTLEGRAIHDIPSFYAEVNRLFMAGEDWKLGQSLDALDDLLYGGYGALQGHARVRLVWRDMEQSRAALGKEATRALYLEKLKQPERYDVGRIKRDLAALEAGTGPTYFQTILDIIASHPNIELVAA